MVDQTINILIVDDDPTILCAIKYFIELNFENAMIESATSAEEAFKITQNEKFNLLITDYKLPKMSGIELLKLLKDSKVEINFMLMTAYSNNTVKKNSKKLNCNEILEKPFSEKTLMEKLSNLI